jgi:hypothetical protein
MHICVEGRKEGRREGGKEGRREGGDKGVADTPIFQTPESVSKVVAGVVRSDRPAEWRGQMR